MINVGDVLNILSSHQPKSAISPIVIANCHPKFK
jgi:hypothetical protein